MRANVTKKEVLINYVIPELKKRFLYFSYNQMHGLLLKNKIVLTKTTFKSYVFEAAKNNIIFDAGKSWYSSVEKMLNLNKEPLYKIIETLNSKLPLLPFCCWSTGQLNHFAHHVLSKHIWFVYVESDHIRSVFNVLKGAGYNVYENPGQAEIRKFFEISSGTVMVLPAITKQPVSSDNAAPVEKILVDFIIENRKIKIMEEQEAIKIVTNAVHSGRLNMAAMLSYSKRRGLKLLGGTNQFQNIFKVEVVG